TRAAPVDGRLQRRYAWFLYVGLVLLIASQYLVVNFVAGNALPQSIGHAGLALGLALMAWNVAQYDALIAGRVLRSDFLAFSATIVGAGALYGAALVILVRPLTFDLLCTALGLLLAAMTTHALWDPARSLIDR